jgi:hypothetical protein
MFCDKNGNVTKVPYKEHVPPDVTAQIFWLKNRDPAPYEDCFLCQMGFHPLKARRSQSIPNLQDVHRQGRTANAVPNKASILPGSVARMALRITGSRELANASRVLPLIPTRRFLISAQPSDQLTFEWISVKTWVY